MKLVKLILGAILILLGSGAFAANITHTIDQTCAHANGNEGEGGCNSNHSGTTVTGGIQLDCHLKKGGTSIEHDNFTLGVGGWTTPNTSSASSFDSSVSGYNTGPGTWCTFHNAYYYDSSGNRYSQTYPTPKFSCDPID